MFYALVVNGSQVEVREMKTPTDRMGCRIPTYMVEFHSFNHEEAMKFAKQQFGDTVVDVVWHCCENLAHLIESAFDAGHRFAKMTDDRPFATPQS